MKTMQQRRPIPIQVIILLCVRLPLLLGLTLEGLRGYSDLLQFYNVAAIPGLPYIHYWSEFPPLFPFLNELLYALAGGAGHTHTYLMVVLLLAADVGSILLFTRLEKLLYPAFESPSWRSLVYAAILGGLPYAWGYFDSLAVFFLLLSLTFALERRSALSVGTALGAGILTKLFPVMILPALAKIQPPRRTAAIAATGLGLFVLPLLVLYAISPEFTHASLTAMSMRRSYETVWALVDNNYAVGGYGPLVERFDPAMADISPRNEPVIPPLLTLAALGGLGLFVWSQARLNTPAQVVAFSGLTLVIFFVWSPAWSPQWVLFLLPFALLTLPMSPGLLLTALMVLVNLLEWPLLLSRGMFYTLPLTILLRLVLMLLLGWLFYQMTTQEARSSISQA